MEDKHQQRKGQPIYSGVLAYFPLAIKEVAKVSFTGNEQHNKGEPLHWAREKSTDQLDCVARHLVDHAKGEVFDTDGMRHLAKVVWRALAELQLELETDKELLEGASPVFKSAKKAIKYLNEHR